ncbi:hypothetical protein RLEG12_04135 (plasmid) [Rhizobium leguminosarum bv. trifolii CB782]|nr:hypothetical protein RLEG12_04135 [Rhizobium leguminosarum bv. trifolii CB782]
MEILDEGCVADYYTCPEPGAAGPTLLLFCRGITMSSKRSGRKSQPHEFIFPVHTRTIAQIRYDSLSRVMTVVYHDGRSTTTTGIQGPAMLRILAQRPLERSPFLLQTVI